MRELRSGRRVEVNLTPFNARNRGLRKDVAQREPLTADSTAAVIDASGEVAMLAGVPIAANDGSELPTANSIAAVDDASGEVTMIAGPPIAANGDSELPVNDSSGGVTTISGTSNAMIGDPGTNTMAEDIAPASSRVTPTNEGPTSGPSTNLTADNTTDDHSDPTGSMPANPSGKVKNMASSGPAADSPNPTVEDTADSPSPGHAQASPSNPTLEVVPKDPTGDAQVDPTSATDESFNALSPGRISNSDPMDGVALDTAIEITDADEEPELEEPGYIVPEFVRRLINDDDLVDEKEDNYDLFDNRGSRQLQRGDRIRSRLNQQLMHHEGTTNRILDRLSIQVMTRDDGEGTIRPDDLSNQEFLRSELDATGATLGILEFVCRRVEAYRRRLSRFRRQLKEQTGGEESGKEVELGTGLKQGRGARKAKRVGKGKGLGKRVHVASN